MTTRKKSMKKLLLQMAAVAAVFWFAWGYLAHRYTLGIDVQQKQCLEYRFYIIDKQDKQIPRNGYVAFRQDERAEPWFDAGTMFIKQVRAKEGDEVMVRGGQVYLAGKQVDVLQQRILSKMGRSSEEFNRRGIVASGDLWVMGTTPDSFDSRYWGPIDQSMVIGQVYPVF